jgi:hypothetical protein
VDVEHLTGTLNNDILSVVASFLDEHFAGRFVALLVSISTTNDLSQC